MATGLPKGIPKLPGLVSEHYKNIGSDFKRSQVLQKASTGKSIDPIPTTRSAEPTDFVYPKKEAVKTKKGHSQSTKYVAKRGIPKWIANERQVLRFYAYFIEKVEEKGTTVDRVRKFIILYYLADSSIQITEPKIENCGFEQGAFLKKTVIKKPDGTTYCPQLDFAIGKTLRISGRKFIIVDADQATRDFYQKALQVKLDSALEYPSGTSKFKEAEKFKLSRSRNPKDCDRMKGRDRQFLENDRKVLRFYCTWDDPHPMYPEKRQYVLHYYLADDTIEVREVKEANSGRDAFPLLLSRGKLKNVRTERDVNELDLRTRRQITVYSRVFDIVDCDDFTRQYYLDKHGVTQEPPVVVKKVEEKRPDIQEEDAGIFRRILAPKPQVKDQRQVQKLDRKVIRFRAKFYKPKSVVDSQRQFVVTMYLVDNSLTIYEPPERNSGIVGGKFLDRGHYYKCDSDSKRFFTPCDLYAGAILSLEFAPHQQLLIVEADERTMKYCESIPDQYPLFDANAAIVSLAEGFQQNQIAVRKEFQKKDQTCDGTVSKNDYEAILNAFGASKTLNDQQLTAIWRKLRKGNELFNYEEFCDIISRADAELRPMNNDRLFKFREKDVSLRRVLKRLDSTGTYRVSKADFIKMIEFYKFDLTREEVQSVFQKFEIGQTNEINYRTFCDAVYKCDFSDEEFDRQSYRSMTARPPSPSMSTHSMDLTGFDSFSTARAPPTAPQSSSNPRVVELLKKKFGQAKYKLRRQLRERDTSRNGLLDEDTFMDALLSVNGDLTDDETYLLADSFFPQSSSKIDYQEFLDSAFKVAAA